MRDGPDFATLSPQEVTMETGSSRSREVLLLGGQLFRDRVEAGRLLAAELQEGAAPEAVVFGLARGGVVVAAEVASALGAPLDALAVRKIGHLFQPEYAIGAVTPDEVYLRAHDGLTDEQVAEAVAGAQAKAAALDARLHERVPRLDPSERTAIVVDDGLATGATMIAALRQARDKGATAVVAAVPVAPAETAALVRKEADELVCLHELDFFGAVAVWYERFEQVSDERVLQLLERARAAPPIRI
jgi:putative phosphoribosyl transferase